MSVLFTNEPQKSVDVDNVMKKRLLLILDYLYSNTDDNNTTTIKEISEYLNEINQPVQDRTIRKDIELITSLGADIVKDFSSPINYFWGNRILDPVEIQMLIGAVSSSRFIDEKRSYNLIEKLTKIASVHQAEFLKKNIIVANRIKTTNTNIYYHINDIIEAIEADKKVELFYDEFDVDKQRISRNDGKGYVLSPYRFHWNDEFLYLVGFCDKHQKISTFRIDRISKMEILREKRVPLDPSIDLTAYADSIFEMYSGKEVKITLECDKDVVKYLIDQFGEDVESYAKNSRTMVASPVVKLSPTFYSWVFKFAGKVKITSPEEAVLGFREMVKKFSSY